MGTATDFTVSCPAHWLAQPSRSVQNCRRKNYGSHGKRSAKNSLTSAINAKDGSSMPYTMPTCGNVWHVRPTRQNRTTVKTAVSKRKNRPENVLPADISLCTRERGASNDKGNLLPKSGTVRFRTECDEENENLSQMRSDCQKRFPVLSQLQSLPYKRNLIRSLSKTAQILYRMRHGHCF